MSDSEESGSSSDSRESGLSFSSGEYLPLGYGLMCYSSKRETALKFFDCGYADEKDLYTLIVKKYFLKRNRFPSDLCKLCYFKCYEILLVQIYGNLFRHHIGILESEFTSSVFAFRCLYLEFEFRLGEESLYNPRQLFGTFIFFLNKIVKIFAKTKKPKYKLSTELFFKDIIPHWSHCIKSRQNIGNIRDVHYALKFKAQQFLDIPGYALSIVTKNKKVRFQKSKEPLDFVKKWKQNI